MQLVSLKKKQLVLGILDIICFIVFQLTEEGIVTKDTIQVFMNEMIPEDAHEMVIK
jgi:hypothetical protein